MAAQDGIVQLFTNSICIALQWLRRPASLKAQGRVRKGKGRGGTEYHIELVCYPSGKT